VNSDQYPEGFDASCGIPARFMRSANSFLAGYQNNRNWDVPALATEMMALVGTSEMDNAKLRAGIKCFLDSIASSHRYFGKRSYDYLATECHPTLDAHDVKLIRYLDEKINPHLVEFKQWAFLQVPEIVLSFCNSPGWRSFQETLAEMERQEKFVLERLGSEPSWLRRTFSRVDKRLMLWHGGWKADINDNGQWTFSARVAALRILA